MSRSSEHDVRNGHLRQAFGSTEDARAASVPTAKVVPAQCHELQLPLHSENVPDSEGAILHWIGDRSAGNVLLYFHGGGYGLAAFPGHIMFLASCMERAAAAGKQFVTAFLEYGLTPSKKYPTQHLQATQALRHVLSAGFAPSTVMIGGDSAGGNMALGLLSIIKHPLPSIPTLGLSAPLRGALLICPWVSFSSDAESFRTNAERDIHGEVSMKQWASDFASNDERNNYTEPVNANVGWWKNAPVEKILVVWGEYELFKDDDKAIAATLASAGLNVETVEGAREVHIDCVLDAQTNMGPGPMSEAIWKWLCTL